MTAGIVKRRKERQLPRMHRRGRAKENKGRRQVYLGKGKQKKKLPPGSGIFIVRFTSDQLSTPKLKEEGAVWAKRGE